MKNKTKFLTFALSSIGMVTSSSLVTTINMPHTQTINNTLNYLEKSNQVYEKTFDARLIGACVGTFDLKFTNPNECILTNVSSDFIAGTDSSYGEPFNFNGGHFLYEGVEYTITEIANNVFKCYTNYYFLNCNVTIPSTIKKIGESAFNGCSLNVPYIIIVKSESEIIEIKFDEGIEYIGKKAFRKCNDTYCNLKKGLTLPNSLKYIGDDAFSRTEIKVFDLTALDHVIKVDSDVDSSSGCLPWSTEKIYVKDEQIKAKYLADEKWHDIAEKKMIVKY